MRLGQLRASGQGLLPGLLDDVEAGSSYGRSLLAIASDKRVTHRRLIHRELHPLYSGRSAAAVSKPVSESETVVIPAVLLLSLF